MQFPNFALFDLFSFFFCMERTKNIIKVFGCVFHVSIATQQGPNFVAISIF